jgi:hypothetical protein
VELRHFTGLQPSTCTGSPDLPPDWGVFSLVFFVVFPVVRYSVLYKYYVLPGSWDEEEELFSSLEEAQARYEVLTNLNNVRVRPVTDTEASL